MGINYILRDLADAYTGAEMVIPPAWQVWLGRGWWLETPSMTWQHVQEGVFRMLSDIAHACISGYKTKLSEDPYRMGLVVLRSPYWPLRFIPARAAQSVIEIMDTWVIDSMGMYGDPIIHRVSDRRLHKLMESNLGETLYSTRCLISGYPVASRRIVDFYTGPRVHDLLRQEPKCSGPTKEWEPRQYPTNKDWHSKTLPSVARHARKLTMVGDAHVSVPFTYSRWY